MKKAHLLPLPDGVAQSPVENIFEWISNEKRLLSIAEVNWPEFPYAPEVSARIYHTPDAFYILFDVLERDLRIAATADGGLIWEDSCVEFFIQPESHQGYYNYEFNAAGKMLLGYGRGRSERISAPGEVLNKVVRYSKITTVHQENACESRCHWRLMVRIAFETLFRHKFTPVSGESIRANLYKCGDKLPQPHFLSWNRIDTLVPDFHRPEFFGVMTFISHP